MRERVFGENFRADFMQKWVVKMKDRLPFYKKFRTLCTEDCVDVDPLFIFEREATLKDSDF